MMCSPAIAILAHKRAFRVETNLAIFESHEQNFLHKCQFRRDVAIIVAGILLVAIRMLVLRLLLLFGGRRLAAALK